MSKVGGNFEDSVMIAGSIDPLPIPDLKSIMFIIDDLENVENCILGENNTIPKPHRSPKSHYPYMLFPLIPFS